MDLSLEDDTWRESPVTELIVSVSRDDTGLERNHWLTVGYGYARGNRDQIDIRRTGHVIIISCEYMGKSS